MGGARMPAPASLVSQPQVTSSRDIHVLHAPVMPQEQHMWAQPVWCQRALPHDLDHPLFLPENPFPDSLLLHLPVLISLRCLSETP